MTKNLIRETRQAVTIADKIRMTMLSYSKNEFDMHNIEQEIKPDKRINSLIQTDLFLWNEYGNAASRTEKQKDEIRIKVESFYIDPKSIICFTNGPLIEPDNHGLGRCGAGVVLYLNSLSNAP